MRQKQIEVYNFYKERYPSALLFFHVKTQYVTLFDDAGQVAKILGMDEHSDSISFDDKDLGFISKLGDAGCEVKLIDCRNESGEHDYPDIEQLKEDEKNDY